MPLDYTEVLLSRSYVHSSVCALVAGVRVEPLRKFKTSRFSSSSINHRIFRRRTWSYLEQVLYHIQPTVSGNLDMQRHGSRPLSSWIHLTLCKRPFKIALRGTTHNRSEVYDQKQTEALPGCHFLLHYEYTVRIQSASSRSARIPLSNIHRTRSHMW